MAGELDAAVRELGNIDERLELELGRDDRGAADLCVAEAAAWPLAELVLAQAPPELARALSLGRAPLPIERALERTRLLHDVDFSRASLRAGFARGHLLEITLGLPGGRGSEMEQIAAENLVRFVLGERLFETWIGQVHVAPTQRSGPLRVLDVSAPRYTLSVHELFDTVAAAALGLLLGLPVSEYAGESGGIAKRQSDWNLLEMEPLDADAALDKSDLVIASTCTPELLRCYLEGAPCASRRFTRGSERFVFVAYPDHEASVSKRVAKRTVIETALSETATHEMVVTGVGLGVKSTYLDLAVCNLETGLPLLVSKLQRLALPRESCIRFFDSELAEEWVAIWPDTRDNEH
jgi:hypothetical protein